jgi:hypothetical protein
MSDEKLAANRANAQHSTGPKTEAGKNRSRLNSYRHGLSGQIFVATPEETVAFQQHSDEIAEALAPVGRLESYYALAIAQDMWRLQRARALENGIFAQGYRENVEQINSGHPEVDTALAQSQTFIDQARTLTLLTVYEQRINRAIEKNTDKLNALQAERKAAFNKAQEQAVLFAELAQAKGEDYQPGNDFMPASAHGGFAYSYPQIVEVCDREYRVLEARSFRLGLHKPKSSAESDLDRAA